MSAATSVDRNQESVGNTMGAPGVAAQQKLEEQAAANSVSTSQQPGSSGQQHGDGRNEHGQQAEQQKQSADDKNSQQEPKA